MATVDRYLRRWVTLPDGRPVAGRFPGASGVSCPEHRFRDLLAAEVRGVTEANLGLGRADVLTSRYVFEVEPAARWRHGVRQALAYSAMSGLPPALALFGAASPDDVLRIYLRLRDGRPPVALWWLNGTVWCEVSSRNACRAMAEAR